MYETSDIRKGLKIEMDGDVYSVVEFQHVKPGKGGAFIRTKLKSLSRGAVLEKTFRSGKSSANLLWKRRRCSFSTVRMTSIALWMRRPMSKAS